MSRIPLALLLPIALAACGGGAPQQQNVDTLDQELAEGISNNGSDPLLTGALQDQIMVDPQLAQKSNADSVRPPSQPYAAPVPATDVAAGPAPAAGEVMRTPPPVAGGCPQCKAADESLTLGALAARQKGRGAPGCIAKLRYAAGWANRLPRDIPLYANARVIEAAGVQDAQCSLRVASFTVPQPMQAMLDWYYTRAVKAGFTAEHQSDGIQHVLGGTRDRDGGAYVLYLTPREGGGTDVDLIANNGV
ncbi:hypothetical protein [Sphingomonas sp. DT-204]|uniref:hypothetical protein n=1 Tax=Sphingomonas sp. DT-204 TaxID=3396166 RepID=UPI003F1C9813